LTEVAGIFSVQLLMKGPMPEQAVVTRLRDGWTGVSIPAAIPRRRHTKPTPDLVKWFDRCTDYVKGGDRLNYFNHADQYDFDIGLFRRYAIKAGEEIIADEDNGKKPPYSLSEEEFRDCVCGYEERKKKWTLGPPGIIRKLKAGWDRTIPMTGRKRKMATKEACREVYYLKTKKRRR